MKGKTIFSIFIFISLSSISSKPLPYQTLYTKSLPNPQPLLWPQDSQTQQEKNTLSLNLHHVDSLSYNTTPQTLFTHRLRRDAARVSALTAAANTTRHHSQDFTSSIISGLSQGSGEYFTRVAIGTPPKKLYLVLDTGSDVVWIQCSPCKKCYSQSDPIFNPNKSTSFSPLSCDNPICRKLDSPGCNTRNKKCLYEVSYGDGSFTFGEFATETLSFRNGKIPNVAFGCGRDNEGLFIGAAGLLGLGRGKLSFINQAGMGKGTNFYGMFSYCLVDRTESSKPSSIIFGAGSAPKAAGFTPLLTNPKLATFYYVGLVGFSVGGRRVSGIDTEMFKIDGSGEGGVIVDSGTSVTRLTRPAYNALRDAFRVGAKGLKKAPEFSLFDTCFDLTGMKEVKVPTVVMHFTGTEVSLPASNYLIPVDSKGTFCFAFAGTTGGLSIIGNIQQQGFRIVYDLAGSRIGFAPRGCA